MPVALHRDYFARHELKSFNSLGNTDLMLQAPAADKADAGASMLLNWLKPLEQGIDIKLPTGRGYRPFPGEKPWVDSRLEALLHEQPTISAAMSLML